MLKTERMTRTLIAGTTDALHETVDFMYASRAFHVINFSRDDIYDIGSPLPEADQASDKLLKMMSISGKLELEDGSVEPEELVSVSKIRADIDAAITHLDLEISSEVHARQEIESLLAVKKEELNSLGPFMHLDFPLSLLSGYDSTAVFCGRLKGDPEPDFRELTDAHEFIRGGELTIIFIEKSHEERAAAILASHGFAERPIPDIDERPGTAAARLVREIDGLEKRLERINSRLENSKKLHGQFITASLEELTIEANRAEAPLRFGMASHSFIIDAWAPSKSIERLESGLESIGSGTVVMVRVESEEEEPPIQLNNPGPVRSMEMLLHMFSLPAYDEIDPAAFMFITFPLFYGLMLGDIGYGIVILLMVMTGGLTKIMTKLGMSGGAPGLNRILFYCGITSIIFGLIYNEFFGFELFAVHGVHGEVTVLLTGIDYPAFTVPGILAFGPVTFPVMRGSQDMVIPMLLFCVWIGIAHIMLGYIVGFRNVWVQHGAKKAILEKGGWVLILTGLTLFAFKAMPDLISGAGIQFGNLQIQIGLALFIGGIAMAFAVEGINTLLELPGLSGNLLSYTRIYAIGLSSVYIAISFNESLALPAIRGGGTGIIIGVLVLIAGHALNIGLGILGPSIQTLRLHYVEFFTKFYKGGGTEFDPLRYDRKYTKEV